LLLFLKNLQETNTHVVLVVFGNIYSLGLFQDFGHLIAAYEDDPVAEQVVPQIIFGVLPATGKLPVSIPGAWQAGWGIKTKTVEML
jgi:beta-N-acetylhexosaminidase